MQVDKIAVAGLIFGVIGAFAGIIGAIAAVFAAIYARGGATQSGLEQILGNTAKTSEQITAVRTHIAQVEQHLKSQNDRHDLGIASNNVRISCSGDAWADEVFHLTLTIADPDFSLEEIELTNDDKFFSGAFPCKRLDERTYLAEITPSAFSQWFGSGKSHTSEIHMLTVKATMIWVDQSIFKTISGFARTTFKQKASGQSAYHNNFSGQG